MTGLSLLQSLNLPHLHVEHGDCSGESGKEEDGVFPQLLR